MYEVQIDFGAGYVDYTAYLVGQYPIKRTRQLHNALKPVTGTCSFAIRNNVALVNAFLTASADPAVKITHDGAAYFAGTIRKTVKVSVGQLRVDALECQCVDPTYRLGRKKIRTSIVWSDYKVSDPTNKSASLLHQLFYLAGFADAELNLAAIDTTVSNYVVDGTDKAVSIRSEIETILRDTVYTLRPTRAGVIELYDLAPESYSPTATIKTGSGGNITEGYSAERDEYKEEAVDVTYWTHKTLADEVVFEDTTGATASLPCSIPITAGAYYPEGAELGESVRGAYQIENEELVCVEGATLEWAHTGDVTLEDSTEDGLGMLLRFHSATGGVITKLRIVGDATIKDQKSKVSEEIVASSDEREEIESKIINTKTPAERLAKGRAAWHKNAVYTYTFHKLTVSGAFSSDTDFPSETDYPSETSYPWEDVLLPGDIVTLSDAILLGAAQTLRVVKVVDGSDPKVYAVECEAVGDYAASPIAGAPRVTFPKTANKYPDTKPLAALTDAVDFDGQYGIYNALRYVGTMPATWVRQSIKRYPDIADAAALAALADMIAGDTVYMTSTRQGYKYSTNWETDGAMQLVLADIQTYTPHYRGRVAYGSLAGTSGNTGDTILAYSATAGECGIYLHATGAWSRQATPATAMISAAWFDILWAVGQSPSNPSTGTDSEKIQAYMGSGINYFEVLAANAAFFNALKAVEGFFTNITVTGKASLSEIVIDGFTAGSVVIKENTTTVAWNPPTSSYVNTPTLAKSMQICGKGILRVTFDLAGGNSSNKSYGQIYRNRAGSSIAIGTLRSSESSTPGTFSEDLAVEAGDIIQLFMYTTIYTSNVRNTLLRISITEQPGLLSYIGS